MRRSLLSTALTTALIGGTMLALPAAAAAPTVDLQPQKLARGVDIVVPHIDEGDFVDGARRVELPGTVARLIGQSGDAWLVGTNNDGVKRNRRVVRVEADSTVTTILTDLDPSTVRLSEDSASLVAVPHSGRRRASVHVWSAADGEPLTTRTFRGYPDVLAMSGNAVLVRSTGRTFWWKTTTKRTRTVTRKQVGLASIEHDLLATYTKDPYRGGCTKLVRLSNPSAKIWRSCRDRVETISPDGTHMATIGILSDGIGPGAVSMREIDGSRLATWTTNWFGTVMWEAPTTLLLDVNGRSRSATVRCTVDVCENATDPVPTEQPRLVG